LTPSSNPSVVILISFLSSDIVQPIGTSLGPGMNPPGGGLVDSGENRPQSIRFSFDSLSREVLLLIFIGCP